mmetsp:Transcript_78045/g.117444  ORF Transcript_78045/g.117444 Transcript_78045/m.117444 type:complete len:238 (+) Transcript_78045:732-1445(+)
MLGIPDIGLFQLLIQIKHIVHIGPLQRRIIGLPHSMRSNGFFHKLPRRITSLFRTVRILNVLQNALLHNLRFRLTQEFRFVSPHLLFFVLQLHDGRSAGDIDIELLGDHSADVFVRRFLMLVLTEDHHVHVQLIHLTTGSFFQPTQTDHRIPVGFKVTFKGDGIAIGKVFSADQFGHARWFGAKVGIGPSAVPFAGLQVGGDEGLLWGRFLFVGRVCFCGFGGCRGKKSGTSGFGGC